MKEREGAKKLEAIHSVTSEKSGVTGIKKDIFKWLQTLDLDAAVWTGLSYSDKTQYQRPSIDYIIDYLKCLHPNKRKHAEEYIRKAPKQIDTEYRRQIELELGWTPLA